MISKYYEFYHDFIMTLNSSTADLVMTLSLGHDSESRSWIWVSVMALSLSHDSESRSSLWVSVITLSLGHQATLNKKSVSCRPGEANKKHPGGREIFFFSEIFFS